MTQSIYEQIGGESAVAAAVEIFYKKVLADPLVNGFFDSTNMEAQAEAGRSRQRQASRGRQAGGGRQAEAGRQRQAGRGRQAEAGRSGLARLLSPTSGGCGFESGRSRQPATLQEGRSPKCRSRHALERGGNGYGTA